MCFTSLLAIAVVIQSNAEYLHTYALAGRGNNVVTRVPLELAMRKGGPETARLWYYTTRGELDTRVEVNDIALCDISEEIAAATVQLAGTGVNIVNNPLHLEMNAGLDQYNLNVIGLPGIVVNPTGGEFASCLLLLCFLRIIAYRKLGCMHA